jgi:ketosteroid isomerase-like protein
MIRAMLGHSAEDGIDGELADMNEADVQDPFHPDIVIREAASLPYGGDWKGVDGLRDLMTTMRSLTKLSPIDVEVFDAGDDHVITRQTALMEDERTGASLRVPMVEVYRMVDGKIAEIDVFYKDTKAMVDFLGRTD